jgi:hypothetical protein
MTMTVIQMRQQGVCMIQLWEATIGAESTVLTVLPTALPTVEAWAHVEDVFELEEFSVLAVYSRLAELLDPGNQLEMFSHENKAGGGGAVGSSSTKWIRRMFRLWMGRMGAASFPETRRAEGMLVNSPSNALDSTYV